MRKGENVIAPIRYGLAGAGFVIGTLIAFQALSQGYPSQGYPGQRSPGQGYPRQEYPSQSYSPREQRCMQLEQRLARDWVQRLTPNQNMPKLREEIRKQDRIFNKAQAKAERADCYEDGFIFGRSLRRSKRCLKLHKRIEAARRSLTRLEEQRKAMTNTGDSVHRRQQLIEALARNGCGRNYQKEARRQQNNFFDQIFGGDDYYEPQPRYDGKQTAHIVPYATYRTMCVRKCDGYYFPISYSALPSKFENDKGQCQSNCAAPAELFIYRNPGEDVEHMISLSGIPYSDLPNAWRYRKEFIKGCSCNTAKYSPVPKDGEEQKGTAVTPVPSEQKTGWEEKKPAAVSTNANSQSGDKKNAPKAVDAKGEQKQVQTSSETGTLAARKNNNEEASLNADRGRKIKKKKKESDSWW